MNDDSPQGQRRSRTTIVVVAGNEKDFEWALEHAVSLARERVIQMSFSKKDDRTTWYEVRTSKMRKVKPR